MARSPDGYDYGAGYQVQDRPQDPTLNPDGSIAGGTFMIDPEQIPALITGIDDALEKLDTIGRTARNLGRIGPPGDDPYSADAVEQIGLTATGGSGSHDTAHDSYVTSLINLRLSLTMVLQSAANQDEATRDSIGGNA